MSDYWQLERVLTFLEDDREVLEQLYVIGACERRSEGLSLEEVETARVARVLVRELDVNWPGVEIILRLRGELLATRAQVGELIDELRKRRAEEQRR